MSTTIKKLPGEPIVIHAMSSDYKLVDELPKSFPKLLEFLGTLEEPVFWLVDISAVAVITVEDLLTGTELVARGEHALYRHPKIKYVVYISTSSMIKMAVDGMTKEAFGKFPISIFNTLDEALAFARKKE